MYVDFAIHIRRDIYTRIKRKKAYITLGGQSEMQKMNGLSQKFKLERIPEINGSNKLAQIMVFQ